MQLAKGFLFAVLILLILPINPQNAKGAKSKSAMKEESAKHPTRSIQKSRELHAREHGIHILRPVMGTRTDAGGTLEVHYQFTEEAGERYVGGRFEVQIELYNVSMSAVYGTPFRTRERFLSYPISAALAPGDYVIAITLAGQRVPRIDPSTRLWAISQPFTVLAAE